MQLLFNRNPITVGGKIDQPPMEIVKNTPSLWNSSLDDALKYGGELTKAAIGAMNIRGKHKHIVVDTKIHMLMPGFYPAIPSWHTDGVPRGKELRPDSKGEPDILSQEQLNPPKFHLLVTGSGCLTEFIRQPLLLDIPEKPTTALYKIINDQIHDALEQDIPPLVEAIPSCTVWEWDWWDLHRGIQATKHEWRFLIRVTETDLFAPQTDLRQIIRTQQQIYVPESFGW